MSYNNISASISPEKMQAIKEAIKLIGDDLPFLISLTADEKRGLIKLGPKSVDFVRDCANVANNYPQILPVGFDATELGKDSLLFEQLSEVKMLLNSLNEKINDTTTAVGNEAMKSSLTVYDYVKTAAKSQPGLKSVAEDLQKRFKGQGKRQNPPKSE
jgi:hypothetical protein